MKILVLSDTHGFLKNAEHVIKGIGGRMDAAIHLGDHDADAVALKKCFAEEFPFYFVKGNNDGASKTPYEQVVSLGGKSLFLTHGHRQQVYWDVSKLVYLARDKGADIALFGHTHMPVNEVCDSVLLLNPGSLSLPRNTSTPTFGIIEITEKGKIEGAIMAYMGKDNFVRINRLPR